MLAGAGNVPVILAKNTPSETIKHFTGTETLPGFGKLTFDLHKNGKVTMIDAKSTSQGIWRREGDQYTLAFANGAVFYTGTLNGTTLAGTATSPRARQEGNRSWTWTVQQ